jgi:hypothetical protein
MKVRELAALLDEQDPEAEVKVGVDQFYVPIQAIRVQRLPRGETVVIE